MSENKLSSSLLYLKSLMQPESNTSVLKQMYRNLVKILNWIFNNSQKLSKLTTSVFLYYLDLL